MLHLMDKPDTLIRSVTDRPHDLRYALDNTKIRALGWRHSITFDQALERTIQWYQHNEWWWRKIKSGEYRSYYEAQYGARLKN
jgi:dTDP-glucose 4,6-dehydratase